MITKKLEVIRSETNQIAMNTIYEECYSTLPQAIDMAKCEFKFKLAGKILHAERI